MKSSDGKTLGGSALDRVLYQWPPISHGGGEACRSASRDVQAKTEAARLAGELRRKLDVPKLNPGSPEQLLGALAAKGIELTDTDEETLAQLEGELGQLILDYRHQAKEASGSSGLLE